MSRRVSDEDLAAAVDWLRSYEPSDDPLDLEVQASLGRVADRLEAERYHRAEARGVRKAARDYGVPLATFRKAVRAARSKGA